MKVVYNKFISKACNIIKETKLNSSHNFLCNTLKVKKNGEQYNNNIIIMNNIIIIMNNNIMYNNNYI